MICACDSRLCHTWNGAYWTALCVCVASVRVHTLVARICHSACTVAWHRCHILNRRQCVMGLVERWINIPGPVAGHGWFEEEMKTPGVGQTIHCRQHDRGNGRWGWLPAGVSVTAVCSHASATVWLHGTVAGVAFSWIVSACNRQCHHHHVFAVAGPVGQKPSLT